MYVVQGRLTAEVGALLMRALEAAGDALFRERGPREASSDKLSSESGLRAASRASERDAAQRRADAVGLLAERALAPGFTGDVPISGTRAERYQVMLHVEPAMLSIENEPEPFESYGRRASAERSALWAEGEPQAHSVGVESEAISVDRESGLAELEDGTRVSAETCRRLTCDASVVRVVHGSRASGGAAVAHGKTASVLNVGRKTRTISPALRRALEVRDRGCRFPGCGLRFTDAHHVAHWADGGETSLDNCTLLCTYHHMLVHEGDWRVQWRGAGRPLFIDPRGGEHFDGGWRPPVLPEQPVMALLQENQRLGIDPDPWATCARWNRGM